MQRKPLAFRAALVAGVLTILSAGFSAVPRVLAQGPLDAVGSGRNVSQWLRDGGRLETEHRWGEALTHFEESLRQFPGDGDLKQHFDTARLHYELGRRYNDRSFRDGLARMSLQESLDLYNEVLLKLQAHYVEPSRSGIDSWPPAPAAWKSPWTRRRTSRPPARIPLGRSWRNSAASCTRPSPRGRSNRGATLARRPKSWPA